VSARSDFADSFAFQADYKNHLADVAQKVTRVEVAGWEDDLRRNTDFLVMAMANNWRITARVRTPEYRDRFRDQITVRLDRPSGLKTELAKLRDGFGDFGIYAFASPDRPGRLVQWCLYNIALLREYLDQGGRWYERRNRDGSSTFAVFDIEEVAGREFGFVLNSEGLRIDAWPPPCGKCRICGHDSWTADTSGPVHVCCGVQGSVGVGCPACDSNTARQHCRWGWPK
jgi:hypothetical protein